MVASACLWGGPSAATFSKVAGAETERICTHHARSTRTKYTHEVHARGKRNENGGKGKCAHFAGTVRIYAGNKKVVID